MVRYILHPGKVISRTDGDWHFIGFGELVRLYRLDQQKCIDGTTLINTRSDDVHLYPMESGNYSLSKEAKL